jgi:hypothetical protein
MKRLLLILLCVCFPVTIWAQHELPSDTLHRSLQTPPEVKQFGNYLFDMHLMNLKTAGNVMKPAFNSNVLSTDFNNLFRWNPNNTVLQGWTTLYGPFTYMGTSFDRYGIYDYGFSSVSGYMQKGSFKLNNGARINVYGQYNADGKMMPGVNIMPWQKHDFNAAFEYKTPNGAFGIKVEVNRQGGASPWY